MKRKLEDVYNENNYLKISNYEYVLLDETIEKESLVYKGLINDLKQTVELSKDKAKMFGLSCYPVYLHINPSIEPNLLNLKEHNLDKNITIKSFASQ